MPTLHYNKNSYSSPQWIWLYMHNGHYKADVRITQPVSAPHPQLVNYQGSLGKDCEEPYTKW